MKISREEKITNILEKHYNNYSRVYHILTAKEVDEILLAELSGKEDYRKPERINRISEILDGYYINYSPEINKEVAKEINTMFINEIKGAEDDG